MSAMPGDPAIREASPPGERRSTDPHGSPRTAALRWSGWIVWLGIAAAFTTRLAGRAGDDIYITYRYAYNLAHGRGLVFNPGQRVFGISDPGVAIVLAALHRLTGLSLPDLGTALTAAALLAVAAILLAAARAAGRELEGWLGGTLLLTSGYVWLGQGAGPLPALALLLLAARTAGSRRPWLSGVLAGLAFLCRPDAALGAAGLGLLVLAEEWRSRRPAPDETRRSWLVRPLVYGAVLAALVLAALAGAQLYFGSWLPGTLAAKHRFAALAPEDFVGLAFWRPAVLYFSLFSGPAGLALLVLGVTGQVIVWRRLGRPGRLLVLHGCALAAFYTLARVPYFVWYTIPTAVAILYGAACLGGALARGVRPALVASPSTPMPGYRRLRLPTLGLGVAALAALAVCLSAVAAGYRSWRQPGPPDWRLFAYRRAGEWMRAHTAPDAAIVFDEVGILAYYGDRPVVDLIGLVTPRSRPFAAVGDPLGAFLAKPPDFLLFHTYDRRGGTRPILVRPWFAAAYEAVAVIPDPAAHAETRIYGRRRGGVVPPPRPPWPRPSRRPARVGSPLGETDITLRRMRGRGSEAEASLW